jgi:hypothetical protein
MVFNTFVFCQIFNEINSRVITRKVNVFQGILKNRIFIGIFFLTIIGQAIIVEFGEKVFHVAKGGLSVTTWLVCIGFGSGSLLVGFFIRVLLPEIERKEETPEEEATELLVGILREVVSECNPHRNEALLDKAIQDVTTQIRVVNSFRYAESDAAFKEGLRIGAEAVMKSLKIEESTGQVQVDRDRVQELWNDARILRHQVNFTRAIRGERKESAFLPGDIYRARFKRKNSNFDH